MKKNVKKLIITLVIVVSVLAAIWFIFLAPYVTFKKNENAVAILCPLYRTGNDINEIQEMQVIEYDCLH